MRSARSKKTLPYAPRISFRVGWGYDSHPFQKGRALILAGIPVTHSHGLKGHSDADAVSHAVIDALLGAAGWGDIGTHFPDTDSRYKNADSVNLVKHVVRLISSRYSVGNVDVTLITENPRLSPYKQRFRARLARVLKVPLDAVNIKAKTNEKMGFVGRAEGLVCVALAVIYPKARKAEQS